MVDIANPSVSRIALVGNPNCGKTALFNALTGSRQKVANYPGVTVERKLGQFVTPGGRRVQVLDLPGTYSLRARSPDEVITRDVVLGRQADEPAPDVVVCVADATNLRQVLRLVLELKQVGRPLILALNMFDIARHRGLEIDLDGLSRALDVPVVTSVAVRKGGTLELMRRLDALADAAPSVPAAGGWSEPAAEEIRRAHREADRILGLAVRQTGRPAIWTARLDRVLLHPVAGIAILLAVLFLMFQAVFSWATPAMDAIKDAFTWLSALVGTTMPDGMLRSLIADGVIAGVGSVLVFLPQILILFTFIILLEDFGYMARAAFLMDRLMGGAGLHGRAFIPLLSSFACAIPGVMATRVIENRRDRLTTILVAPLMTCSARIPVYTLIISAFVPRATVAGFIDLQGLVMFGLYATGIISALAVALVLRRVFWRGSVEPFLLELPNYKLPDLKNVVLGVLQRARIFMRRAGTIILSLMILIWFLSSVPGAPEGATDPAINYSIAGRLGHAIAPALAPVGFNWQIAIALIPGLAAREVAVAALGTVYAVGATGDALHGTLASTLAAQWSLPTAFALLAWYIFAPQCAATLGVVRRETNSWRWPAFLFAYMIGLAYLAAFATFHITTALGF
ncbi:MAG TPA: ferrous iron transporter B [Candidatus Sulfotelmatobacter sp.]|nr:ferrous iron transporter B [Candidatus Sulfotelmatobacter sp.]